MRSEKFGVVRVAWCASGAWRSLNASLDATREQVMLIGSAKLRLFGKRTTRAACQSFASRDTQRDDHATLAHQATRATPISRFARANPAISSSGDVERRRVRGERTRARTTEPPRPEPRTAPGSLPSEAQRRTCTREASTGGQRPRLPLPTRMKGDLNRR